MLFEAQVKANENQCSSENSVPTSDDFVQTNPSNDEKDTDHLRQVIFFACFLPLFTYDSIFLQHFIKSKYIVCNSQQLIS